MTLVRRRSSPNSRSRQIGGADRPAVAERKLQMRDARREVVIEAGYRRGQIPTVGRRNVVAQQARQRRRGRLVARRSAGLELRPDILGTLLCRLRILCAKQRWRNERGRHSSMARMIPGAPSLTTSSGSGKPRRRMSWKNSRQLAVSSLVPGAKCNSAFLPSARIAQAASTASRR